MKPAIPLVLVSLASLLWACSDEEGGGVSDSGDGGDAFACPEGADCPSVAVGTSALLVTRPGATGLFDALVSGDASLFAFHGEDVTLAPLLWGSPEEADGSVDLQVTSHTGDDDPGTELHSSSIAYEAGPGGRFQADPVVVQAPSDASFLRVVTTGRRRDDSPYNALDANLRIDLFEPTWRGADGPEIAIPLHVWRVRTSNDHYGAALTEAQLAQVFDDKHTDPAAPLTVNEIYAPVGIRFEAEIDTLMTPPEWDFMARRVPCDVDAGLCYRTRRRDFAEAFGDPNAINVFVVYFIAQDDAPPADDDDIEDSLFGLTFQTTYRQAPFSVLPGVWLSSKIWLSTRDSRTWAPRIVAHEIGHALDTDHHERLSSRLLMTSTSEAEPTDTYAGTAIVDLPEADSYWTTMREHAAEFAASHPLQ